MALKRREVRIKAMQILYAKEISHDPVEPIIATLAQDMESDKDQYAFVEQIVYKVLNHAAELDTLIIDFAQNWNFERIATIDKILLRICVCELLYFPEIPPKVSINEAIEIAKRYSTDNSSSFINGIIDAIKMELIRSNRLNKTGRGLIGVSTDFSQK